MRAVAEQQTLDGQPSPVPIAKPVSPLPLAGAPTSSPVPSASATDQGGQALPGGLPTLAPASPAPASSNPLSAIMQRVKDAQATTTASPAPVADPYLGSPTVAGSHTNAADAERVFQQASNPAIGGNAANEPAAAQVYQTAIDPTQSYVPSQQVQDAQQVAQANPATSNGGPVVLPLAPPAQAADTTPSLPASLPALGNANETPPPGGLPLAPTQPPADASPSIPALSALDPAPIAPTPDQIPLATSNTPSGVPISNQDLTGATIGGAPAPSPIAPTAQTNFANDLTGQTLGVGQTPDRLALAQSMFDTFQKQSDPAYQAAVREAESNGAALGQLGSGGLRTSVGNLAAQRNLALEGERQSLTNSALEGSIGDAYKNVGISQQQQGFQAGQKDAAFGQAAQQQGVQNANNQFNTGVAQQQQATQIGQQGTAFNQAATQAQIQEALTNGDFNRALAIYNAGNQNSPNLALAADYTGQAQGAGAAASGLVQNAVGNANTQIPPWLQALLQQQGGTPSAPSQIPLSPAYPPD